MSLEDQTPMHPTNNPSDRRHCARTRPRGFALIVTLSLMILLTVIAVGLLTLSSISLRTSSQGDAMQAARANARMALMLAIGDLQKQLGPDTRISAPADQLAGSPKTQRQWAGAYNAWPATLPNAARPTPTFLQWFVSGDPTKVITRDYAGTAIAPNPQNSVEIVTAKSVGTDGDPVRVPLLTQTAANGAKNSLAWWVSDLGTKGLISPAKDIPTAIAEVRADPQTAPAFNLKAAASGTSKPFANLAATDPLLPNVVSLQSSALLADKPENIRGFYHDFTAQSRGLLTNVRKGGFRKDLSMELERPNTQLDPTATANVLYKVGSGSNTENGINFQELGAYYNLYKEVKRSGGATFTTSGSMSSGSPYLQLEASVAACQTDEEFYLKQPVVISYQLALSLQVRDVSVTVGSTTSIVRRLHIVADPIITLWNPLDVPVVVPPNFPLTVKYWMIPYDFRITKNGTQLDCPMARSSLKDSNFLSLEVGVLQQLVFKPGEVIKMSQTGNTLARGDTGATDNHALAGKKGFNFGGGYALPLLTSAGANIDVGSGDTFTYVSATPNNLTAGSTGTDGHTITGGEPHKRHYSLTHHEYYVGKDRGDNTTSLGIGGIFLDWDFGNKRLKPSENRGPTPPGIAGTKPSAARYDATQKKDIFKTFTDNGTIPTTGTKKPILLLSFNAKTENGSTLGTRSLSRFNPKALHVDFYDLSPKERDMLPYEYTVEQLDSWVNRKLEQSSNGSAYFGGGMDAADGTSSVTTHSVPREPIVSLAAFQHSFANGFDILKPKYGYGTINAREPLLPQISHAIGNSSACPVIAKDKTEGSLPGSRPTADHSYLANQALWDDWFLSGIAPQTTGFTTSRTQKVVATEFFNGTTKLPVARYIQDLRGQDATKLASTYFPSTTPSAAATAIMASLIRVDGMFNINSTSVEAWKSLLGARKDRPLLIRDANGKESILATQADTPVAGLMAPMIDVAEGNLALTDTAQWTGRRALTDDEIDQLARGIVKEVRKRGPFLSLADFINRRVGSDADLARAGAIQNALDSNDVKINETYQSGTRATSTGANFDFPDAERGPKSQGIPGIVKQADILTPIAPILSARSDSFLVRAYGEKTDAAGKVIARAWCEAVVQRSPEFIDKTDLPEKLYSSISTLNKTFGRRFDVVSFRWLSASEA